jgi:hypothetical protein
MSNSTVLLITILFKLLHTQAAVYTTVIVISEPWPLGCLDAKVQVGQLPSLAQCPYGFLLEVEIYIYIFSNNKFTHKNNKQCYRVVQTVVIVVVVPTVVFKLNKI